MERHPIPVIHPGFNWLGCLTGFAVLTMACALSYVAVAPLTSQLYAFLIEWTKLVLDTIVMLRKF